MLEDIVGYKFIPLVDHPGVVMYVREMSATQLVKKMLTSMLGIWPLVFVNLLMMIIAGFAVWMMENGFSTKNETDFSSLLLTGIQEGWYWAFVTQGTHGYGDFVPKNVVSRLFSIIWIFTGMILTSIVVGTVVTALMSTNEAVGDVKIYGSNVGALESSFEMQLGVLRNGNIDTERKYFTVAELADAIKIGSIEVALVDAFTAGSYQQEFDHPLVRLSNIIKTSRSYGFVISGDLVNVYEDMRDFVESNQARILNILQNSTTRMKAAKTREQKSLFDPDSTILHKALIVCFVMYAISVLLGITVQFWRRKRKHRSVSDAILHKGMTCQQHNALVEIIKNFGEEFSSKLKKLCDRQEAELLKLYFKLRTKKANIIRKHPPMLSTISIQTQFSHESTISLQTVFSGESVSSCNKDLDSDIQSASTLVTAFIHEMHYSNNTDNDSFLSSSPSQSSGHQTVQIHHSPSECTPYPAEGPTDELTEIYAKDVEECDVYASSSVRMDTIFQSSKSSLNESKERECDVYAPSSVRMDNVLQSSKSNLNEINHNKNLQHLENKTDEKRDDTISNDDTCNGQVDKDEDDMTLDNKESCEYVEIPSHKYDKVEKVAINDDMLNTPKDQMITSNISGPAVKIEKEMT